MNKDMNLSSLFHREGHLILDDISTWPNELLEMLDREQTALKNYKQEQGRINHDAISNYSYRLNPPPNQFQHGMDALMLECYF